MGCRAKMEQVVPNGPYDYKTVDAVCGQTSIHGTELRCEDCSKKRPWYICEHGKDHRHHDMACFECEMGE